MKRVASVCLSLTLGACATKAAPPSGFLSSYDGMAPKESLRAAVNRRADVDALAGVRTVAIEPTVFGPTAKVGFMNDEERAMLLREVDAQLCFELTESYDLAPAGEADAVVRAAVTKVEPTGRASSVAAAAASFFIPGPIGIRPGEAGSLSVEAEMLDRSQTQLGALTWSRKATMIGTDNPSLSKIGDAMQFTEPFGDAAGKAFRPKDREPRKIESATDPCRGFGPRFRIEGFAAKMATGLYVPEMSNAKASKAPPVETAAAPAQAASNAVATEPLMAEPRVLSVEPWSRTR